MSPDFKLSFSNLIFDFHHFPCQSLKANHVWGLMGIIAYNLMRLVSFTISRDGCFANTVRKKVVLRACEVIKRALYFLETPLCGQSLTRERENCGDRRIYVMDFGFQAV